EMLVSIIDKGLLRIGEDEKNSTIYHHSVTDKYAMTMGDIIYKYRYVWLLLAVLLLGLIKFAMLKAQYYKKLKIKTIEAENANEAKSDFLSRVSHDMRTPMNAIIGFSQIAMTSHISMEEMRGFMVKINSSGKYMLGLINDVLDMAKIEKKKMVLQKAPVDGEKFIRDIDSIIRPQMDERAVNFYIELINIDTKKSAVIDEMRVKQIFINLLNNAAKFTPKGGRVDCIFECVEMKGDTAKYKVLVRDTGIGMPEDFLPLLFTPFVQGSNSDIQKGTGLGLSIVKALVDLIGGTISVESKEGSGTTFTVEFSAQLVEKSDQEEKPNTDISKLSGAKILLCEDHPLNAQIAEKLLSHVGARTEIAANGEEGVNMFKASPMGYFDIILM
ncbi:MAG: ATP-binding protein, partial [Oscillospiraceae bacterium]